MWLPVVLLHDINVRLKIGSQKLSEFLFFLDIVHLHAHLQTLD